MLEIIWSGLFPPLIGFLILIFLGNKMRRQLVSVIACSTLFISFCSFSYLLIIYHQNDFESFTALLFRWLPIAGINADFALHLDPVSLLMTLIITGVGFLIHVYSTGYMDHEEDYVRFFACMNLFVFAMLLLVLASNLLLLFVGWEGVGLASYLLIGYYYAKPSAAKAAKKAFIVNRIGDLGLLLGILLTFHLFGTSEIVNIIQQATEKFPVGAPIITVLTLLYFVGAVGKSAQLPLHTWLPDAMEGPTPVSALIHAATMVTAGVYLIVRLHPIFLLAPDTLNVVAVIGAVTSLFAALCAMGQTDLKRVLAYSTMSQLGLMFLACGVGAFYAAMFHLTMHAFIKALLFLSAGNVLHMLHGKTEMIQMGGLSKYLPQTNKLFMVGIIALSGIPPLAAFFSKDLILEQTSATGFHVLYYISFVACVLTAYYLMRAYVITFTGPTRLDEKQQLTVKEAPSVMIWPLGLLALLSIGGGFMGYSFGQSSPLENFLAKVNVKLAIQDPTFNLLLDPEAWLSVVGAIGGVLAAIFIYTRIGGRTNPPIQVFYKTFYIDEIYNFLIVKPLKKISETIEAFFEPKVFEGSISQSAKSSQTMAIALQKMQSGQIRSYMAWIVLGTTALLVLIVLMK